MRPLKPFLIGVSGVGALAAVLVVSGCGGGGGQAKKTTAKPWLTRGGMVTRSHPLTNGHLTFAIKPRGSRGHTSPGNFAVEPGVPLTLTFINSTPEQHSFTAPGLGVSALISAGSKRMPTKTVVTFTPNKFGVFRWHCVFCRDEMSGHVYAIIE